MPLERVFVGVLEQNCRVAVASLGGSRLDWHKLVIDDLATLAHLLQLDGLVELGLALVEVVLLLLQGRARTVVFGFRSD